MFRATSVAALGATPCGLDDENRLTPDTLPHLDTVVTEAVLLLARPPAAELHRAVGKEVRPAPVRFRKERRRHPRVILAAGCPTYENSTGERVPLGDLDVGRDIDPGGVDTPIVAVSLVVFRRGVGGNLPWLRPDSFRLSLVRVHAAPDLDATRSSAVV